MTPLEIPIGIKKLNLTLDASKSDTAKVEVMRLDLKEPSAELETGGSMVAPWFYLVGRRPF